DCIAALGTVNQQIAMPFDDKRSLAKAEHALYGIDQSRLGLFGFRFSRLFRLAQNARENLARRVFSESHGRLQILNAGETVVGCEFEHIRLGNFLEAAAELSCFLLEQAIAHLRGFFALLNIDPMTNLAA